MKKVLSLVLVGFSIAILGACGDDAVENKAPVLTVPSNAVTINVGESFDPVVGATADNGEGVDITADIEVIGGPDGTQVGNFSYILKITDDGGLVDTATISLTVVDPASSNVTPVIAGYRSEKIILVGEAFDPQDGVVVVDEEDGDITADLVISGDYDISFPGDYVITYTVEDSLGAVANATTTLSVKASTDEYVGYYSMDIDNLNYMQANDSTNNQHFANFIDGLVENDRFGVLRPSLAESFSSSVDENDVQTWEFVIRDGVQWMQQDGTPFQVDGQDVLVTAEDWVTPAKWLLNPANGSLTTNLWFQFVDGAAEYYYSMEMKAYLAEDAANTVNDEAAPVYTGLKDDFVYDAAFTFEDMVGVYVNDAGNLEYRLTRPAPYFPTVLTYSPFFPVSADYLDSGVVFGGTDGSSILYNGAYLLKAVTAGSHISYEQNPTYWDIDQVHISTVELSYYPEDAGPSFLRTAFENDEATGFRVQENDIVGWQRYVSGYCADDVCEGDIENPVNPSAYTLDAGNTVTYYIPWNFNRVDISGNLIAPEANAAINNTNFRLAMLHGIQRSSFTAKYTGEDAAEQWLRNTYMPSGLSIDENGDDYIVTFTAYFAEQQGMTIAEAEAQLADGQDGLYDHDLAQSYWAAFVSDAVVGVDLSDGLELDLLTYPSASTMQYSQELANQINSEFPDVTVNVLSVTESLTATQWGERLDAGDYDFTYTGWGPDYADPATFLNTLTSYGDMIGYSGLNDNTDVLGDFDTLVQEAESFWALDELSARYSVFAEAEYKVIYEDAIIIPFFAPYLGKSVNVSRVKPYVSLSAPYGLSDDKYKGMIILVNPLTRNEREILKAEFDELKAIALAE